MKRTKRFLAMLLTLILCVSEFGITGITVLADNPIGIGTKLYMGEQIPETDAFFKVGYDCNTYNGMRYQGEDITRLRSNAIIPEPESVVENSYFGYFYRTTFFHGVTEDRFHDFRIDGEYTITDILVDSGSWIEDLETIGLRIDSGDGSEENPYTFEPILAGPDEQYVAVIFNDNIDGRMTERVFIKNGEKATKPSDPIVEGKEFTGWYTDPACKTSFDFNTALSDNKMLYAGWKSGATFEVRFCVGKYNSTPTVYATKFVEPGGVVEKPEVDPTMINWIFTGWYTSKECLEIDRFDFSTPINTDLILYAGWDEVERYDLWVGDTRVTGANMDSIPCDSGTASYDPETNTLTFKDAVINKGYEYSEGSGRYAAIYTKDSSLTIKGDLTIDPTVLPSGGNAFRAIYAESSEYKGNTLELDADITIKGYTRGINALYTDVSIAGGLLELEATKSVVTIQDAKLDLSDGVKVTSPDGAAFREETRGEVKVIELFESATSDTVVTKATIGSTKPSYTVTFDMNGHGDAIDAVKVTEGKTVAEPEAPKADGWVFGGWYTSKDCKDDEKYDFTKAVTGDITLYAKWTGVERTVTFDANGKTATDMPEAQKVENGKTATLPDKEPKAEGFKFAGWYKDAAGTTAFDFAVPITADTTVYAKWVEATVDTFTVTFDLNGRPGTAPAPQTVEKGKTATRPATDPAAEGYKFTGWYKEAACTDKYNFDSPVTADIIIYAGWEKISVPDDKISALDPKPVIDETTKELYLVKGQKFTLDSSWSVDNSNKDKFKAYKKLISIGKKGNVSAKKPGDAVIVKKDAEGNVVQTISVNICKPELNKKTLTLEAGEKGNAGLSGYGDLEVYYYCASPDVATVAPDGTVTAVAKGTAKVTAYVNGSAYTRSVKVKETSAVKERTLHLSLDSSPKTVKLKGVKNTVWDYAEGTTEDEKAVVDIKNAKVTAKKAGTVTLTAKGDYTTYTMTVKVDDAAIQPAHVNDKYDLKPAAKGKNKYTLAIKQGEELDISYADLDQPVVFKSNKPETAFIDENGHIEARSQGNAKFTAKINGKSITISVKVD